MDHSKCGEGHPQFAALWQQDVLGEDLEEKEPGCRTGPTKPINLFEGNGITQCASTFRLKRATDSRRSTICVLPWIVRFFIYIMMIFIYCGRGERMRVCHNLNRSNSTPVPLNAHLWLAAFYCPPSSGAAGECVCVCRRISQPSGWPLILLLQAVASLPSFFFQYLLEARAKESVSLQC